MTQPWLVIAERIAFHPRIPPLKAWCRQCGAQAIGYRYPYLRPGQAGDAAVAARQARGLTALAQTPVCFACANLACDQWQGASALGLLDFAARTPRAVQVYLVMIGNDAGVTRCLRVDHSGAFVDTLARRWRNELYLP